jgi:hypothetical protein
MADEQLIKLLEEMRDLQKQHLDHYKIALSNQQQALENQKGAVKRARIMLLIVGAIVVALYLLPAFWWTATWGLRCALRR